MPDVISQAKNNPPRMISSFVGGFNSIANKVYIILFPVGLDLLLWFGPLVRIRGILLPVFNRATEMSAAAYGEEGVALIERSNEVWGMLLERFNLLSVLRTFPVGIPSLMASQGSVRNPLGAPLIMEIPSSVTAVGMVFFFFLAGIVLGSIYFSIVARAALHSSEPLKMDNLVWQLGQTTLLSTILFFLAILLGIPLMCFMSSIMFFMPSLGTIPIMLFGMILVWVLLPLTFSPHGIFANQIKATKAVTTSVKMVRSLMAPTGIFYILVILLGYGLDALWSSPHTTSWMMLVGIIGHGFISSGLLAATFIYYRDGVEWLYGQFREKENPTEPAVS